MANAERPDRAADARVAPYAPLAFSLALHALLLFLAAPWLLMRSVPAPPLEVEVMIETEKSEPPSSQPDDAERLRAKAVSAPQRPPAPVRPAPVEPLRSIDTRIEAPTA